MPSQLVISVRHDPKGTGVPQTQMITKTKKILPKEAKSNRLDGTLNNSNTQFPDIFRDR